MKANEFVKRFGLDRAKQFVNADSTAHDLVFAATGVSFIDLKRLVDSHELVEIYGGYDLAKNVMQITPLRKSSYDLIENLKQAIADVESCK